MSEKCRIKNNNNNIITNNNNSDNTTSTSRRTDGGKNKVGIRLHTCLHEGLTNFVHSYLQNHETLLHKDTESGLNLITLYGV